MLHNDIPELGTHPTLENAVSCMFVHPQAEQCKGADGFLQIGKVKGVVRECARQE